jgi:hypothetical protein
MYLFKYVCVLLQWVLRRSVHYFVADSQSTLATLSTAARGTTGTLLEFDYYKLSNKNWSTSSILQEDVPNFCLHSLYGFLLFMHLGENFCIHSALPIVCEGGGGG